MITFDEFVKTIGDVQALNVEHWDLFAAFPDQPWEGILASAYEFVDSAAGDKHLCAWGLIAWYLVGCQIGRQQAHQETT